MSVRLTNVNLQDLIWLFLANHASGFYHFTFKYICKGKIKPDMKGMKGDTVKTLNNWCINMIL